MVKEAGRFSVKRHNSMRHNIKRIILGNAHSQGKRRVFTLMATVLMVVALCVSHSGPAYSESRRAGAKAERKSDTRKKDDKSAETHKKEERKDEKKGEDEVASSDGKGADESRKEGDGAPKAEEKGAISMRDYSEEDFRPQVEEESYVWLVFKTLFVLGSIVGGFYFFFRFVTKKTGIQLLGQEVIKVLSVTPLGQNKYLQVVDLAGRVLVLGVTDNAINVISEIVEKDEIDRIRILSSRGAQVKPGGFQEYLTAQMGRVIEKVTELRHRDRVATVTEVGDETDLSYLRDHRKRLRDLNGNDNESQ